MWGKRIFLCLLISMMVLGFAGCKSEEEKAAEQAKRNWAMTSDEAQMSIYCALIKEYMLLVENLGENTPYPAMKRSVKGNMMSGGMTQSEAIANAKDVIIMEQAVFWYGEQAGIPATDKEVKQYIEENVLEEIQASDHYAAVDEACAQEGITFEDTIWAYEDSYKMQYILLEAGVESAQEVEFVNDLIETYSKTEQYAAVQTVLDTCAQLLADHITDKDTLKSADIYYH